MSIYAKKKSILIIGDFVFFKNSIPVTGCIISFIVVFKLKQKGFHKISTETCYLPSCKLPKDF